MKKPLRTESENNPFEGTAAAVSTAPRREYLFGIEKEEKHEEKQMVKVKMNQNVTICLDGIRPTDFKEGEIVDLPESIAAALLEDNRASSCCGKALPGAPENKMRKGPSINKADIKKVEYGNLK